VTLGRATLLCIGVFVVGYVARGDALLNDDKNGGVRDVVTVVMLYAALLGLAAILCVVLVRVATRSP
jgi:hypothetical protein